MPLDITIRPEQPQDMAAIDEITRQAFLNHPYSRQTEVFIIHALRRAQSLSLSLVAELAQEVVGHIAFSPAEIADGSPDWYFLGPISVKPSLQRQGIGKALLNTGMEMLAKQGAQGFALVGDPGYYHPLGFRSPTELSFPGVPAANFMTLPLNNAMPKGQVTCHQAFHATA